ncbi:MAG TPA: glycosyltransferase family 39 protein [Candidatus Polarisedimenticolaceae bacterium]|nr:glycosyltransferase family 39 protein [Candidatus Polarisedimenticolaceae bacterium]
MSERDASPPGRGRWIVAVVVFAAALAVRRGIEIRAHVEGDERIYHALVEQWDAGRGYTLQGHPLLQEPGTDVEQYGQKLFFHPPGGIALFWVAHRFFGDPGFMLVEVLSFAVFFWATLALTALLVRPFGIFEATVGSLLAGFSPIVVQVTARWWLDGPVVALATLAAVLGLVAARRGSVAWAAGAGLALGAAALVKPTAFLIMPGLALLALIAAKDAGVKPARRAAAVALGTAAACYGVWLLWRWHVTGTPFPGYAGRPMPRLVATNPYVHYVTVERGPLVYLRLLPEVLPTLVPACVLTAMQSGRVRLRSISLALVAWIATIVIVHVGLGAIGFSKVLRYVILVSPAAIVLFVAQSSALLRAGLPRSAGRWVLAVACAAAVVLEIVQGIHTMVLDRDLIIPWPWGL